jgi:diaminohydroxyphosphoribosylaminopyrimidine deaminase/5-amino-6-(5-phosphoribosylamino)uracil reductase
MNDDLIFMRRCLELAQLGIQEVAPNPMVGAVIALDGKIIGEGYHQKFGEAHAEVNAIRSVKDKSKLSDSTIYVSLEPCSHFGKTPPCSDLLIQYQFKRVVIACQDPNPKVAGKGIAKLQKAGIETTLGVMEKEAIFLNRRFFTFQNKKRPYIVLKWAQSADGFIDKTRNANEPAKINWISSPETKTLVHHWRSQEQAILIGKQTVINDNPNLTVREIYGKNPIRIIIDSQLQTPLASKLFTDGSKTIVLNRLKTEQHGNILYHQIDQLNTEKILDALYELNIQSVLVEGGSRTLQHFIVNRKWDEAKVIRSSNNFESGTKAPVLQEIPNSHKLFFSDQIFFYSR